MHLIFFPFRFPTDSSTTCGPLSRIIARGARFAAAGV
jgi:hypothetical protein